MSNPPRKKKDYIYFDEDATLKPLEGKVVCIVGYGNQGRSQALNLRDSGVSVIIGNISDDSFKRAEKDKFKVFSIPEAVKKSDVVFFLVPDEVMPKIFKTAVSPNLKDGSTVVFASGYNIAFGLIELKPQVNVLMLAPRMIGLGVRERFLTGEGFYSFICVHQDFTKKSKELLLALCKAVGALKKCSIEVSMKQEAILDLFNEQAFGPAFGRVLLSSIDVLLKHNLPPEAVLCEMYLSEEMSYTYKAMARIGLVDQVNLHSHTSQYGSMSRGLRYLGMGKVLSKKFEQTFDEIDSGAFAKEWNGTLAKLKFKVIKYFATKQYISKLEKEVRESLRLRKYKQDEVFAGIEEILKNKNMEKEIKELKNLYNENLE